MLTVAEEWLNACSGCEVALLNLGEALLDLLPHLNFVHIPVLADNKYYGSRGEGTTMNLPEADVGIISGGVRNSEHLEVLRLMRSKVRVLVALGTCAATGGLPGLANICGTRAVEEASFVTAPSLAAGKHVQPDPAAHNIPRLLPHCTPLSAHVTVDLVLPGCPPHPDWIAEALTALLQGRPAVLPDRSVCSTCPTRRFGRSGSERGRIKRLLEQPEYDADKPLSAMRCLLEQGFLCMGPVTLAGCGGKCRPPKCIAARTPCSGCQGPLQHGALPFADYMGALAAVGINGAAMPDKPGYLSRYHSAQLELLNLLEDK